MALLAATQVAFAAPAPDKTMGSRIDLYYSNLDLKAKYQGDSESIDGDGGGMAMWLGNGWGLFTAEFQKNKLDGSSGGVGIDAHARQLRVGLGGQFINTPQAGAWLRAEYLDFDADLSVDGLGSADDTQKGYGIHAGGRMGQGPLNGYAEIGRIELDDLDGWEYRLGANYQPGIVGGLVEYRFTDLKTDNLGIKEEYEDIRVGVRIAFQ
jgi:hypothetical protein